MGYGMKYTKGGFPFKSTPAKQKVDPDAPGTPGTPGFEPPVTSMDYLTKTPNPTVKAEVKIKPKRNETKFMNEQDHQSVPTFTNSNPSPNDQALANAKSKNYTKHSDLEKHDDDRPYAIKEAAAGNKQDKKEDAEGK